MTKTEGLAARRLRNQVATANCVERRMKAFEMKVNGDTCETIARKLGCSAMTISTDVAHRISELEHLGRNEEAMIAHWHIAMLRLEAIFKHHFDLSAEGNPQSAAICLRAVEQMTKLAGFEAGKPQGKLEVLGHTQIMDRIRESSPALVARIAELSIAREKIAESRAGITGPTGGKIPMPPAQAVDMEVC